VQEEQVLDPAVVAELRRARDAYGNPDFIRQLVGLFRNNTPGKMGRIREALAARDGGAIVAVAHTLKTNCAMLGATRMAEACARLEEAAGRAASDTAAVTFAHAAFKEAEAAFSDAEAELPAVLTALSHLE
jgi:HPt (histidine-containing phosphotransfer) domain-containing protein